MLGFINEGKAQSGVDYQGRKKTLSNPSVWKIILSKKRDREQNDALGKSINIFCYHRWNFKCLN